MEGLCDREPVANGEVIRVETTGGGGWGDPFDRSSALVADDMRHGKVSPEAAEHDYGVLLDGSGVDELATLARREQLRADRGPAPFFDRGPGYETLSGQAAADVDKV